MQKIKPFKYEIIIVDDGSKDKTTKVKLLSFLINYFVLSINMNLGIL